jgi:hypothetical protein
MVEEDEPDEAVLEGCSPEHEGAQERGEKGAVKAEVLVAFYRGRGSTGEEWPGW